MSTPTPLEPMRLPSSLTERVYAAVAEDSCIAYRFDDGDEGDDERALWVTDAQHLTPTAFAELLVQWEAALPHRGELLHDRRRHTVYRLETAEFGPVVLKYTNPGKTKRRSAVAAWLTGRRLHRALPGAVAEPLAAVDRYRGNARAGDQGNDQANEVVTACLVCRYIDAHPLDEAVMAEDLHAGELAGRIGRFQARLHRSGLHLKDCRLGNLLMVTEASAVRSQWAEAGSDDNEGLTIVDLEALAEGEPTPFNAARLLLKLRLAPGDFARVWAAYVRERGEELSAAERLLLWWLYWPLRCVRHHLVRFNRRRLRPLLGKTRHGLPVDRAQHRE
ncbi:hypothetical protein CKO15_01010 [Halorhodospira abdelmalekii]|uniref:hypothetical protein n=1 Tax=Halorhodospira abdelmalekii TaxID=421629 RepID=UPI001908BE02|nr:hypothetical protein [Halorhodospira abdelmalekii]MBK1733880.1 hypothetical protein [Halorhodospira abdelmalekii]